MTDAKRRRLMQAGVSLPLLGLTGVRAQDRNLLATERKAAATAPASGASLLIAPRHALVIGNSSYGFGPLKNPANDAKALGEELKRTGFEVTIGLDLTRQQMLEAIRAYGESLNQSKAIGVFYFAGHGLQLAWRNYLVPTDASISKMEDIQARCVDVNAVIEGIARAVNPMNVVILDACRENPFGGDVKLDQKGLSQLDAPPGTILAYATAPGNLASDGDGANGLYTEQLLREIMVPEAKIEDVFKRVRLTVRRRSNGQQIPWESTSLEEDFWFIPPKEMQKLAAAEAERVRKEKEAERLWQERIEKAQREAAEAERQRQEQVAKAQRAEADRIRREAEAERARVEAAEKKRREQIEREYKAELERRRKQEESDRAYEDELRYWQKVSTASEPGPLEEYLRRYPSGRFAEICQAQLDRILERQGEKKVEITPQAANPYTQGSATVNTKYQVGDLFTYNQIDLFSKVVTETFTLRVTGITDSRVIFNGGRVISDLLGNPVRVGDGREFTPNQIAPLELKVGKRWSTRFTVTNPRMGAFATSLDLRVIGKESVRVPAGTFECFRIEARGQTVGGQNGIVQSIHNKIWLCPERVRRAVAVENLRTMMGRPNLADRLELVSFQQG